MGVVVDNGSWWWKTKRRSREFGEFGPSLLGYVARFYQPDFCRRTTARRRRGTVTGRTDVVSLASWPAAFEGRLWWRERRLAGMYSPA